MVDTPKGFNTSKGAYTPKGLNINKGFDIHKEGSTPNLRIDTVMRTVITIPLITTHRK